MYELLSSFAQTWGMFFMIALFVGVLAYALWPGNRAKFRSAAAEPLRDDPPAAAENAADSPRETRP